MSLQDRPKLLEALVEAALEAGEEVWRHFQGSVEVMTKTDQSPVTAADQAAEAIILRALASAAPEVPVVAEEEAAAGRTPDVANAFFLVDPLDGTKEFIRKGNDFTVNIGLIEGGSPTLGVVYAPALSRLFAGDVTLGLAWTADVAPGVRDTRRRRPIRVRQHGDGLCAVASKSHATPGTEAYLAQIGCTDRVSIGSSLKFALLAAGEADIYPRPSPTMEWDTAAGDAVLRAAGGRVFDLDGQPFVYGKPRFFNEGFLATATFNAPPLRPFLEV
jgi:3'(2'), 5'-bisphosphate nucleotidase